jgi:hypothetical protein
MTMRQTDLPQRLVKPGPWPTPTQLLLLRACLESGADARAAWEQWSSIVELDHLDYESIYLLPMLDHNLRAIGVTGHPWPGRIKGYRRYIWAKNLWLLAQGSQLVRELRPLVGEQLLVIKGAALACHYYPDPGLRTMEDFDFMIKPESVPRVLNYLKTSGWKMPQWIDRLRNRQGPDVGTQSRLDQIPTGFSSRYSQIIRRDDRVEIDLHWYLMDDLCGTAANETFWDAAVPMQLPDGSEVRTLESSDLLVHCCLHGLLWSPVPPTRWIVDAVILLQDVESIRWQRLIDLAERFRYTLRLGTALKYLASTFPRQANIPEGVIHSLLERDHSAEEVGEHQERMQPFPGGEKYPPSALTYYRRFRAHSMPRNGGWIQEVRSFANFLMNAWDLPNLWLVFVLAPFLAARRIYRKYFRVGRARAAAVLGSAAGSRGRI